MRLFYIPETGDTVVDVRDDKTCTVESFNVQSHVVKCVRLEDLYTVFVPLQSLRFVAKCGQGENV